MAKLKRELSLFNVVVAGVGIILGAGIYALIGIGANLAGNATWLAFLITALVALFTGLSYSELSGMFKGNAGEYDYLASAFNRKVGIFAGLAIIFAGVVSAATVSLGFGGYLSNLIPIPVLVGALLLILVMSYINFKGIKQSNNFNMLSTFIEFIGLLLIIFIGLPRIGSVNLLEMPTGLPGVFSSAAVLFFAYMGFESIIKLSEETKDSGKNIPKALIYSIVITAVIYVLVAIAAVSVIPWNELANSNAPLASVAAAVFGSPAFIILAIIALFSTSNTVLITLVTTSRMMYGISKRKAFPDSLSKVHKKNKTPHIAIFILMLFTLAFVLIGDIGLVANITNLLLFITFAGVNLSLLILRYKNKNKTCFTCKFNIGRFSTIALLGLLSNLFMIGFVIRNLIVG